MQAYKPRNSSAASSTEAQCRITTSSGAGMLYLGMGISSLNTSFLNSMSCSGHAYCSEIYYNPAHNLAHNWKVSGILNPPLGISLTACHRDGGCGNTVFRFSSSTMMGISHAAIRSVYMADVRPSQCVHAPARCFLNKGQGALFYHNASFAVGLNRDRQRAN